MANRKKAPQIQIKKLSLCGHDFTKFIKQIDENEYYLVKIKGSWHCGHIRFVGIGSRNDRNEGHSWDFDLGSYGTQLSYKDPYRLDENWKAVYRISDPDLIAEKAKLLLSEKKKK
jgi:hypothetical protein